MRKRGWLYIFSLCAVYLGTLLVCTGCDINICDLPAAAPRQLQISNLKAPHPFPQLPKSLGLIGSPSPHLNVNVPWHMYMRIFSPIDHICWRSVILLVVMWQHGKCFISFMAVINMPSQWTRLYKQTWTSKDVFPFTTLACLACKAASKWLTKENCCSLTYSIFADILIKIRTTAFSKQFPKIWIHNLKLCWVNVTVGQEGVSFRWKTCF